MADVIDLNSDLGESFAAWSMGDDAAMLEVVTSANVACGFHAGDPMVMHATLELASAKGVAVGAHSSRASARATSRSRSPTRSVASWASPPSPAARSATSRRTARSPTSPPRTRIWRGPSRAPCGRSTAA
jgi:hypothetical protein